MSDPTAWLLVGGAVCAALGWLLWRRGRASRKAVAAATWITASLLFAAGAYSYRYHHRPLPEPVTELLFEGVAYTREVRRDPEPVIIHMVTIDLDVPGIGFLVTPSDPFRGRKLRAATTSQFLKKHGVQLAINGGPFSPWHEKGPLMYYPHVGDPVDPSGLAISNGHAYSSPHERHPALCFSRDNHVTIGEVSAEAHNAVSGFRVIVREGRPVSGLAAGWARRVPRTAAAIDTGGRRLMLFVVDGRQPNYSEGLADAALAEFMVSRGAYTGIKLDGGGSSTLVVEGPDGAARVLNSPIHGRVPPGRERPVATHLGVFARRLQPGSR